MSAGGTGGGPTLKVTTRGLSEGLRQSDDPDEAIEHGELPLVQAFDILAGFLHLSGYDGHRSRPPQVVLEGPGGTFTFENRRGKLVCLVSRRPVTPDNAIRMAFPGIDAIVEEYENRPLTRDERVGSLLLGSIAFIAGLAVLLFAGGNGAGRVAAIWIGVILMAFGAIASWSYVSGKRNREKRRGGPYYWLRRENGDDGDRDVDVGDID